MAKSPKKFIMIPLFAILGVIVILALLYFFVAKPYEISGNAMSPTVNDGEILYAYYYYPSIHTLKRGDIILFQKPSSTTDYISRVIGLPGDRVEVKSGEVFVNGNKLSEPYVTGFTTIEGLLANLSPDDVYVLSDNREASTDSRNFGSVPITNIKAVYLLP